MKNIAILGSTGSIGLNALNVVRRFPERFRVVGLSANSNIRLLEDQIREFGPKFVCVGDPQAAGRLKNRILRGQKFFVGKDGLEALAEEKPIDKIVLAVSGSEALAPLLKGIESGKDIALANKEALVMAGPLIMKLASRKKVNILPIDSEQSAIWQCLAGQDRLRLKNIYLTASGGPFLNTGYRALKKVRLKDVLKHPRWKMGRKITVDSATMMNKGLELLEAMFLFACPADKIKVLIHPEAVIHSMVEFVDGVVLAQLSVTDMRIPIQYALTYPERLSGALAGIDFYKLRELNFEKPDFKRFPCLGLAQRAAKELGTLPAVLNAANEVGVEGFIKGRVSFPAIAGVTERVMDRHRNKNNPGLNEILQADSWARQESGRVMGRFN